jgi:hypothetical protein
MAASNACILPNINNSEISQLSRTISCQNHNACWRNTHKAIDDDINEVHDYIAMTTQAQKDLKAQLKELNKKKKEAGRMPRHNRVAAQKFDSVMIPAI